MNKVKFEDLLSTGAHFGHVTSKWNPNFKPFILMEKNGVHIINLDQTILYLDKALGFIQNLAKKKGEFLFVGTKKQAQVAIQEAADRCGMYYVVERWLGGTLTNFATIKKSIRRLISLEKESGELYASLTKKEITSLIMQVTKTFQVVQNSQTMRQNHF